MHIPVIARQAMCAYCIITVMTKYIGTSAVQEVKEETSYTIDFNNMPQLQEHHEGQKISFEAFWPAGIDNNNVEECRWFWQRELERLTVFTRRRDEIKNTEDTILDPFLRMFS